MGFPSLPTFLVGECEPEGLSNKWLASDKKAQNTKLFVSFGNSIEPGAGTSGRNG